jgi:hypothetical protein
MKNSLLTQWMLCLACLSGGIVLGQDAKRGAFDLALGVRGGYHFAEATRLRTDSVRMGPGQATTWAAMIQTRLRLRPRWYLQAGCEVETWVRKLDMFYSARPEITFPLDLLHRVGSLVVPLSVSWTALGVEQPWEWQVGAGAGYRLNATFLDPNVPGQGMAYVAPNQPPIRLYVSPSEIQTHHWFVNATLSSLYRLPNQQRIRATLQYQHGLTNLYRGEITHFPDDQALRGSYVSSGHMLHLSIAYVFQPKIRRHRSEPAAQPLQPAGSR